MQFCPCSPDVGDCTRCSTLRGGGVPKSQHGNQQQGKKDLLKALDFLFSLPLEGGANVGGAEFLAYFEHLLKKTPRRSTRRGRSTRKQRPLKHRGGNAALQQALLAVAGYDVFQGTPCEAILGCVNVVLMAVSVYTIAVEFQRAYRASAQHGTGASVLGRIQTATSQALASEAVANSIASPLRFLAAQLTPRGLVGFDQMFDTLNTAVRRMVSLLTLNMVVEEGMPATGIGAIAVGILRWQINTQLHLRFVETPLACTLMESGIVSCRDRCLGMGSVVPDASHEGL